MKIGEIDVAIIRSKEGITHWWIYRLESGSYKGFCFKGSGEQLKCESQKMGTLDEVCEHIADDLDLIADEVVSSAKGQFDKDLRDN